MYKGTDLYIQESLAPDRSVDLALMSSISLGSELLFTPLEVGNVTLQHRIVMSPLTRYRADADHVPSDIMVEYYSQRASTPGTLLIAEATIIAPRAGGYEHAPGIWNEQQVKAWKKVY